MVQNWLETPTHADFVRMQWMGLGFLITAGLIRARTLFIWWPFHPTGFALAQAGYSMPWVWFPMLLGWLAKTLILRYGGVLSYRRCIPWFMGLILGDIVTACLWSILGVILDQRMYLFFPG